MDRISLRTIGAVFTTTLVIGAVLWIGIRSLTVFSGHSNASEFNTGQQTGNPLTLCTSTNARINNADAYEVATGQPLALYARSETAAGKHYESVYVLGTAPTGTGLAEAYETVTQNLTITHSKKQVPVLVACLDRSNEQKTAQTCDYEEGKSIPVVDASYQLTIYEARSHKLLQSAKIPSNPNYICGSLTAYDGTGFYKQWSRAEAAAVLYPFAAK